MPWSAWTLYLPRLEQRFPTFRLSPPPSATTGGATWSANRQARTNDARPEDVPLPHAIAAILFAALVLS